MLLHPSAAAAADEAAPTSLTLGYGVGAVSVAEYPGADEHRAAVVPFPYVRYRSRFLDVERDRVRGKLWSNANWALDISLGGALPLKADDNDARRGMHDLDLVVEAGPSLKWRPFERRRPLDLRFELPVRAAFALGDGSLRQVGWLAIPQVQVDWQGRNGATVWGFEASAGVQFADAEYHAYYYGVDPAFASAERPAYAVEQGRGATRLLFAITARRGQFWLGTFVRRVELRDATFLDSPLVRVHSNTDIGLAMAWLIEMRP